MLTTGSGCNIPRILTLSIICAAKIVCDPNFANDARKFPMYNSPKPGTSIDKINATPGFFLYAFA
jgi:hypothetical protein